MQIGHLAQAALPRLPALEERVAGFERVRATLKHLEEACAGHGGLASCPILATLSEEVP